MEEKMLTFHLYRMQIEFVFFLLLKKCIQEEEYKLISYFATSMLQEGSQSPLEAHSFLTLIEQSERHGRIKVGAFFHLKEFLQGIITGEFREQNFA